MVKIEIDYEKKYGYLKIIREVPTPEGQKYTGRLILCKCDCGVEKVIKLTNVVNGATTSCGCQKFKNSKENGLKSRRTFLNVGDVYGRLKVKREVEGIRYNNQKRDHRQYECECTCGNICVVQMRHLTAGKTTSCGCYRIERSLETITKHDMHKTSEYKAWQSLKQRCYNPKTIHFKDYGGRGLTVCDRWLESFENFFEDMGFKPTPTHSIDRIDNHKLIDAYSKDNCRWATKKEQVDNRRINESK